MLGPITLVSVLAVSLGATLGEHEHESNLSSLLLERQAGNTDEVEKLKAELRLAGPEARLKRESAVSALLGMKAPAAHLALQEVLQASEDPDDVIPAILAQLLPRLKNERDPVFEVDKEAGAKVRTSYLRPLILLAGSRHPRPPVVTERALEALREAYASWDRLPVFRALLSGPDGQDRLAAVRAAGRCRDLSVARELGGHLEDGDPDVRAAVAESLRQLTFRQLAFVNKTELDTWFEQVGSKSFLDLAVQRAVDGERELAEVRQRSRAALEQLVLELIGSYVRHPEIQWKKIQEHVLGDEGFTWVCLDGLRGLLAGTETLAGSAPDRLAFFAQLEQRLSADPELDAGQRALLLEVCAYLVSPGEAQSATIVERLVEGLSSSHARVRLAAVSGLRRHPSESNRRQVVEAARAALATEAYDMLRVALGTLHARDWTAPLPDLGASRGRTEWVALLNDVIRRHQLPLDVREEALRVLDLLDASQERVAEGFDILVTLVRDHAQDAKFRERALIQLQEYVTDAASGERYVALLEECLADDFKEIRGSAAERIHQLPDVSEPAQLEAWTERLVESARMRLLLEPHADVHRRLADSMRLAAARQMAGRVASANGKNLGEQLRIAAEELAAAPADQSASFRRKNVSAALSLLASGQDVEVAFWVSAGEALLALGERSAARAVLERHEQNQTLRKPGTSPTWVNRAALLTINTALRRGQEETWNEAAHQSEAQAVLRAVTALSAAAALPADPEINLLLMDIHGDFGEDDKVIALAESLPTNGENDMSEPARQRAALRAARSYLARGRPDRAYEWLMGLSRHGTVAVAVLDLIETTASALLDNKDYVPAEKAGAVLVEHTPKSSPTYGARLLLHAEALLGADPASKDEVRTVLESSRAQFEGEGVPPDLAQKYETLLARASDGSGG